MMFAEATPPNADNFLQFFLILSLLGNVATPVIVLFINSRKQKREVNFAFTPASKAEFDQHVKDNNEKFEFLTSEMKKDRDAATVAASISRKSLYDKLDFFRKELSDGTNSVRKELNEKIDDLPDRVIATLRNTGAIGA